MTARKLFFPVFVICFVVLMSGCSITRRGTVTIDPELPVEQTALVTISDALTVYAYNGIDVSKTWYPGGKGRVNTVTLPAGETALTFDMNATFETYQMLNQVFHNVNMEDIEIRYNFETGKEYSIGVFATRTEDSNFLISKHIVTLVIWGKTFRDAIPRGNHRDFILKSWELGEF